MPLFCSLSRISLHSTLDITFPVDNNQTWKSSLRGYSGLAIVMPRHAETKSSAAADSAVSVWFEGQIQRTIFAAQYLERMAGHARSEKRKPAIVHNLETLL